MWAWFGFARVEGSDGEEDEDDGDDGGGVEDLVVVGVEGVVEEEVVLWVEAGEDRHVDLYEAALVGGGEDVEGGESRPGRGGLPYWWCFQCDALGAVFGCGRGG